MIRSSQISSSMCFTCGSFSAVPHSAKSSISRNAFAWCFAGSESKNSATTSFPSAVAYNSTSSIVHHPRVKAAARFVIYNISHWICLCQVNPASSSIDRFFGKQKAPNRAGALSGVWCSIVIAVNYLALATTTTKSTLLSFFLPVLNLMPSSILPFLLVAEVVFSAVSTMPAAFSQLSALRAESGTSTRT